MSVPFFISLRLGICKIKPSQCGTLLSLIRNKNKLYVIIYGLALNRICKEICIYFKLNTCIYLSLIRKNFEFWKF
jgi:hypothetical protein